MDVTFIVLFRARCAGVTRTDDGEGGGTQEGREDGGQVLLQEAARGEAQKGHLSAATEGPHSQARRAAAADASSTVRNLIFLCSCGAGRC